MSASRFSAVTASAETQLLLCCAHRRVSLDLQHRIDELLEGDLDWSHFIELSLLHRVTPLVHRNLTGATRVPTEIAAALATHFERNTRRSEWLVQELLEILAALERRGIPAVPYKGPALAQVAYGDVALRLMGDLDFLVREEHIAATCEELEQRGYVESIEYETGRKLSDDEQRRIRSYQCEYLYIRPRDESMIEPHWDIAPKTFALRLDHEGFWQRVGRLELGGQTVRCFSNEDLLLVLCIHAAKQEWAELRWVCDVAELIRAVPTLDWDACLSRAADQGCSRMLGVGLELALLLLDPELPVPDAVRNTAARDASVQKLVDVSAQRMFEMRRRWPGVYRLSFYQVRLRERMRDKLAYVFRTATSVQVEFTRKLPLPGFASFLYTPIKLLLSALVFPIWNRVKHRVRVQSPEPLPAQVADWSARSASWKAWADEPDGLSAALCDIALQMSDVATGRRVLDVACGVGEPLFSAAQELGEGKLAVGIDLSQGMLKAARRRLRGAGTALCTARMEALPFAGASFDRVLCRFGIEHAGEPQDVLAEILRVLEPGGSVTLLVWSPGAGEPMAATVRATIDNLFGGAAEADPAALRLSKPGQMAAALRRAGFTDVREEGRVVRSAGSASPWWLPLELGYGSFVRALPEATRSALETQLAQRYEQMKGPDAQELSVRIAFGVSPDQGNSSGDRRA